jgi:Kef-type K+ transport system membrane component KefB
LSQDFAASLTVAAAFTATSVGIPVRVWRNHEALDTPAGERFLDVAELDDITGVLLMALLFAMLPVIQGEGQENTSLWTTFAWTLARFIGMFVGFCLVCFLFSKYLEERMTKLLNRLESPPDPAIVVAGIGIVIAAAAGLMGFSVAVGAFFAGLVFSRDPERVRLDASFGPLYEFMMPFFFIGIGLVVAPSQLVNGASIGALLAVFAILSKVVGASLPALKFTGYAGAAVLGVSMIPRAEITMVIMKRAHSMGSGIVTDQLFSGMVFVSAITATFAPLVLYRMLKRYSGKEGVL